MKRHILLTIAIASFLVSEGQILPKDTILSAYTNQTSIQALNSITLKNGFTIPSGRNVTISIVAFPTLVSQPSAGQNYILTKTFREPGVTLLTLNASRNIGQENQSIQYVDGLGRPLQTVQLMASPTYKDIIQHIEHDGFGRESKKYLPYGENTVTNGSYRTNAGTQVLNYYAATATGKGWDGHVKKTPNPYAVTVFENSPLNRVLEQGAPGLAWQPATDRGAVLTTSTSGHTVVTDYGTNVASDVRMWTVTAAGTGATSAFYAAGKLYKTVFKDENWIKTNGKQGTIEEYKDIEDRVVLKRVWETDSKRLETHYVYDDFGNLRYVIPPGYTTTTVTDNNVDFNELLYAYKYDGKRRMIEKKVPGKGWEYLVYNKNDQVILSQDAVQRGLKKWSYSKYDAFGRIASAGIYTNITANQTTRAQIQTLADAIAPQWESRTGTAYSISSFPTTASQLQELTVNYYDDYSFKTATVLAITTGLDSTSRVKGLLTGTRVRMDDGTSPLLTVNYYDDYGRVIQTAADNHIGGTDYVTNTYSFVGELKTSTRLHKDKAGTQTTTVTSNEYDHVGRLLATTHHIGDVSNAVTLTKNEYNEIGQLKKNSVGGDKNGANFHSAVDYAYNERGWTSSAISAQFSYALKYNDASAGKQYNGNIAEQQWGHGTVLSNVFNHNYDALNRLKNGSSTGNIMSEVLTYDDMGNIRTLTRDGATMTYAYNNANKSNRLLSVTGGELSGNYTYDVNGNAKKDRTGMNFNYNHLNLPDSAWNDTKTVKVGYLYDATGTKLRKYSTQGGNRDYVGGIEYNGTAIELIHTGVGIANRNSNGTYTYRYNLTDNLGNVRSTVYRNPTNNLVEVLQKDDYYPFGKQRIVAAGNNKYLYNGKETQGELGGQYDYGVRLYDAEIGRWNAIDPLAENYYLWSPFAYTLNNPIRFVDPDGTSTYVIQNSDGSYRVVGGDKDDGDRNIYMIGFKEGNFTGMKSIGESATMTSFYNTDKDQSGKEYGWMGNINPKDNSGKNFLDDLAREDPSLGHYTENATTGKKYDFKTTNGTAEPIFSKTEQYFRGMLIATNSDGTKVYGSARDVGNIGAGYVAGMLRLTWQRSRQAFDKLESTQKGKHSIETIGTQNAQRLGWETGIRDSRKGMGALPYRWIRALPKAYRYLTEK